jgi:hypothetical protein
MSKKILNEGGIRDINKLAKRYQYAKIFFHQDLDGVVTAIGMKDYLQRNGIKVVDAEIIQYGDKEFTIKKPMANSEIMPVLVDFAHGKPIFKIHTDHHDSQAGADDTDAVSFRSARSNVESISQIVSPSDIFPSDDITIISTVDSANYAVHGIKPEQVTNFIKTVDSEKSAGDNKMLFGLVVNKLLLAYKNKPNFLEQLVMECTPSLINIYLKIREVAKQNGYASPEDMTANHENYVEKQKDSPNVEYKDGIIVQYGGGSMFKPGSYDRYTPFKNYPDADFLVIAWPMGLVQASCNPFKEDRALKGVNLGEIANEIIDEMRDWGKDKIVPLSTIKHVSEGSKVEKLENPIGFTFSDLKALYADEELEGMSRSYLKVIESIMSKPSNELTDKQWDVLNKIGIPLIKIIERNSGGHKCITNISGLQYFRRAMKPSYGKYTPKKDNSVTPYVALTKNVQGKMVEKLRAQIANSNIEESAKTFKITESQFKTIIGRLAE